jgi:neutral/alkaline ceramidase-like enzyme
MHTAVVRTIVRPALVLAAAAFICGIERLPATAQTSNQTGEWRAGLAAVKITPEGPIRMAGYAQRNRPSEGVVADLYAKVLAVADSRGERAVWITTDLIGLRGAVTEQILGRVMERTGLKRHQLLVNSSHTHTGPAMADSDVAAYNLNDEAAGILRAYRQMLGDRIVAVVERALSQMEPAELSYGSGVVPFVMSRREFTRDRGIVLGVNPRGAADRTMPLLKVTAPGGKLRAVVFGAATHNTTLTGDEYRITGDYAGFAQEYVQKHVPGVQAMFVLGFAGDSNPYPRGTLELAQQHGETLGREVLRVLEGKLTPIRGPLNLQFDHVNLPLAKAPDRAGIEKMTAKGEPSWRSWMANRMLEALDKGETLPTHYRAPVAVWQFGGDLTLVALSGEVVVDYVHLIEHAIGPLQLWLSGYNNDVFGYFPSARVLAEGGYETRGVVHGGPGFFAPAAQDALVAKVKELAAKAGRATAAF